MVLPDDTSSASSARRFVRENLRSWGADEHCETAVLLISELVTNAVLHARSAPEVVMRYEGTVLRIEVYDQSSVLPARRHYGLQAGTGRGIVLVEEMASDWGADQTGSGKVVWFELRPGSGLAQAFALDGETLADLAELAGLAGGDRSSGSGPATAGVDAERARTPSDRDRGDQLARHPRGVLAGTWR